MPEGASDNPVLVEVTRSGIVESRHRGAVAITDASGRMLLAIGDVETPIFPRSAVKAMQALPLIESGAADAFGLGNDEIAVACASHSGEAIHVAAVRSLLAKAGLDESLLACGAHWPLSEDAARELIRGGQRPLPVHNNCSGKHAGMLATSVHLGFEVRGYEQPEHPLQIMIERVISESCGVALEQSPMGVDGCSVPTWALPLKALAQGFARFGSGEAFTTERKAAAERLRRACYDVPALVAGEGRLDTIILRGVGPSVFVKGGAEGVHCAAFPDLGLGLALKVDDGTKRGAEHVLCALIGAITPAASSLLAERLGGAIRNWKGLQVGQIRASEKLMAAAAETQRAS